MSTSVHSITITGFNVHCSDPSLARLMRENNIRINGVSPKELKIEYVLERFRHVYGKIRFDIKNIIPQRGSIAYDIMRLAIPIYVSLFEGIFIPLIEHISGVVVRHVVKDGKQARYNRAAYISVIAPPRDIAMLKIHLMRVSQDVEVRVRIIRQQLLNLFAVVMGFPHENVSTFHIVPLAILVMRIKDERMAQVMFSEKNIRDMPLTFACDGKTPNSRKTVATVARYVHQNLKDGAIRAKCWDILLTCVDLFLVYA